MANHTVSHQKLHLLPTADVKREVANADEVLSAITGRRPRCCARHTATLPRGCSTPSVSRHCLEHRHAGLLR